MGSPLYRRPRSGARWGAVFVGLCIAWCGVSAAAVGDTHTAGAPGRRIETLEREGAARPSAAAAALEDLTAELLPGSGDWVLAMAVRGHLLALAGNPALANRVADLLESPAGGADASPAARAAASLVRARVQSREGSTGRAERLLADAQQLLAGSPASVLSLHVAQALGQVNEDRGQTDEAVRLYLLALEQATQIGAPWRRAGVLRRLAWITAEMGQLARAVTLNHEALELAAAEGDHVLMSTIQNTEGFIQAKLGDKAAERRAAAAALDEARAGGAPRMEALMLANMADLHLRFGDFSLAQSTAEQGLRLAREFDDRDAETLALTNRGLALVSQRRLAEGKRDLAASLEIDERRGSLAGMVATLADAGRYLESVGDLEGALEAYLRWRPLADRALRVDQQKTVLEMQESFDHAQRQRELAVLQADGELQRERLRAQTLQARVWLIAAVAGALAIGILAALAQRVRRSNLELARLNQQLEVQSGHDALTGLANRRRFMSAMERFAENGQLRGSIVLIDIDHFKRINDRFGHAAGDAVLVEVARRLLQSVRAGDLVVRWGGEEFLVVARDLATESVEHMAQRMLDRIAGEPFAYEGLSIAVSASVGWATFPVEPSRLSVPWEQALDLVDTALYLAKAHGRNRGYGVRTLQAAHESELASIAASLEEAWRGGRVALTLLQGPPPHGLAA